jgi:hypothetical protein
MPACYKEGAHRPQQAALPNTVMANAFLQALVRWAVARRSGGIVLPIGITTGDEIALVLRALGLLDRGAS